VQYQNIWINLVIADVDPTTIQPRTHVQHSWDLVNPRSVHTY